MLSAYRHHKANCRHKADEGSKECRCALWAKGTLDGNPYQKSLKTRNWKAAERIICDLETNGFQGYLQLRRCRQDALLDIHDWLFRAPLSPNHAVLGESLLRDRPSKQDIEIDWHVAYTEVMKMGEGRKENAELYAKRQKDGDILNQ